MLRMACCANPRPARHLARQRKGAVGAPAAGAAPAQSYAGMRGDVQCTTDISTCKSSGKGDRDLLAACTLVSAQAALLLRCFLAGVIDLI